MCRNTWDGGKSSSVLLLDEIVFLNWFLHLKKIYVDMGCVLHHWILKIGI
jgi:hypothetical protein